MTTATAEHLERLRFHLMGWVGERVATARQAGQTLDEISLDAEEWGAVKAYFGRKEVHWDKRFGEMMDHEGGLFVQGVWLGFTCRNPVFGARPA